MFREIKKKRLILENRMPYTEETANYIRELDAVDFTCSSLRLDGFSIDRAHVEQIVRGSFVEDCSILEHVAVRGCCDALAEARALAGTGAGLGPASMERLHSLLYPDAAQGYRRRNPVVRALDYIPPHFNEVDEQMAALWRWAATDVLGVDPVMKAALLHDRFIQVYPYDTGTEAAARLALQYTLLQNGLPPVAIPLSEQAYNAAVHHSLKRRDEKPPLYDVLLQGVFDKLELLMQLTKA